MTRKTIAIILIFFPLCIFTASAQRKLTIVGNVYEIVGKTPLQGSTVKLLDAQGTVVDSTKTSGVTYHGSVGTDMSQYSFAVPRTEGARYIIEADYPGYDIGYLDVTIADLGGRETRRELPPIYLMRARQLQEVTVTASKVKFYHKQDTLVYDASAFQLADGSMLDALVSQMPGVELKDNGQIYVNGRFVESLLLNGRDFFGKDNRLMLDNLGAYAVKDVAVYERSGEKSKFLGVDMPDDKDFVMDVRLKKEYQHGWMVNLEGGGGTQERYMGRGFGLYFTPLSQIGIFGAINNVNDQRKPGQSTTWTPDNAPRGDQKVSQAGIDYNLNFNDNRDFLMGNVKFSRISDNTTVGTEQTNFLSSGNTYDYRFSRAKRRTTRIYQSNYLRFRRKYITTSVNEDVDYSNYKNSDSYSAAAFDAEKQSMNREVIDDIYSSAYTDLRDGLMNRSLQRNIENGHKLRATVEYGNGFKFKKNNDNISYNFDLTYEEEKSDLFKDYTINYGNESAPAHKKSEYYNRPNKTYTLDAHIEYTYQLNAGGYIQPEYIFTHNTRDKDSQRYLLDRLEEDNIFGMLPAGYLSALDADNSFTSRYRDNTHQLSLRIAPELGKQLTLQLTPRLYIFDQSLDYRRGGVNHRVNRNKVAFGLYTRTDLTYRFAYKDDPAMGSYASQYVKLSYLITPRTPDLLYLVPIRDEIDPLNIYEGVESLDNESFHQIELTYAVKPYSWFSNSLILGYNITDNMLTRGYSYDTHTGVRTIRSYNTDGNWERFINNTLSWQFGSKKQFTLSSISRAEQQHMSDMIGVNASPVKSTVKNWFLTENLKLDWQLGQQKLGLRGDVIWRDTRSTREDFTPFQATTLNYGVTGVFKFPANFGLSTDLTCYTRRGYADNALNTTDVVWNARLSYTAFKGHWVFMLDGYDILNQLSNVTYGVNAQARTVTYTNVLPRYAMLHVQYKFSINPKKR